MTRRLLSALILLWYLVSFAGIDVHTDMEHGRTYVVPALLAQSCEMIHPHEHCHDHDGTPANDGCDEDEDCCRDDFESVTYTATDSGAPEQTILYAKVLPSFFMTVSSGCAPAESHRGTVRKYGPPPLKQSPIITFCTIRA